MMDKLVSIGMSVYNCSPYIDDTIKSILKQTYTNWELIIINDGSTDDTLAKVQKIKDSRVKVYSDNQNKGIAARLNECITLSKGHYFARMDADDIMTQNRLETQIRFLETHRNIDVVGSLAIIIDENAEVVARMTKDVPKNAQEVAQKGGYFVHPTVVGGLDWFKKHQYDVTMTRVEDFELWLRTFDSSNFFILDDYLLFYRILTKTYRSKYFYSYKFSKRVLKKHRDKISQRLYYSIVGMAYFKYLFFHVLNKVGLLNRKTPISADEKIRYQAELDKIIEKY